MSIAAYSLAIRNHLRERLSDFYDNVPLKNANCKVMLNERPTAACGQEFIAIYGSSHAPKSKRAMQAIEEEFGLTVAVSKKIAVIPPDKRGELGYITPPNFHKLGGDDEDHFYNTWISLEERCREIVGLLVGADRYHVMNEANNFLVDEDDDPRGVNFSEPLLWLGTDANPTEVGPDHFYSYDELTQDSDPVFGLMMKIYFGEAIRLQAVDLYA